MNVGDIVMIQGSDTPWEITLVNKFSVDLRDTGMGIVELEDVPISEIMEVLSSSEPDDHEE